MQNDSDYKSAIWNDWWYIENELIIKKNGDWCAFSHLQPFQPGILNSQHKNMAHVSLIVLNSFVIDICGITALKIACFDCNESYWNTSGPNESD